VVEKANKNCPHATMIAKIINPSLFPKTLSTRIPPIIGNIILGRL